MRKHIRVMGLDDDLQEKIILQYERIRVSNLCNMLNCLDVEYIALRLDSKELYDFMKDDVNNYLDLLHNLQTLMKKFGVKQKS